MNFEESPVTWRIEVVPPVEAYGFNSLRRSCSDCVFYTVAHDNSPSGIGTVHFHKVNDQWIGIIWGGAV